MLTVVLDVGNIFQKLKTLNPYPGLLNILVFGLYPMQVKIENGGENSKPQYI